MKWGLKLFIILEKLIVPVFETTYKFWYVSVCEWGKTVDLKMLPGLLRFIVSPASLKDLVAPLGELEMILALPGDVCEVKGFAVFF